MVEIELPPNRWRPNLWWVIEVVSFNEALALPIALTTYSTGVNWRTAITGASVYTQCIGTLCFLAGGLMEGRCADFSGRARIALSLSINVILGIVGGLMAASILTFGLGYRGYRNSASALLVDLATAASVVLLVTIGKITQTRLKLALEVSEQSLRERELAEERLLKAKSEAELAALQARINPHFLFNTLNSIAALIGDEPAKAEQVLAQLSSLMRYTLQSNRAGVVSLDDELTIVRGYLEIEAVRLGDRLRYEIDIDPALRGAELPILLLQPLVENAIKHGIAPKISGGRLVVRGWCEHHDAIFTIVDDGNGDGDKRTVGFGEGLQNVRQRLDALYGARASVTLTRHDGLTETRVMLPCAPGGAVGG